jgi:uncharacterized protein (TIGR02996 family)
MIPLDHALLAAVLAAPNDDLPRLAAADWWEEQGEVARAEFIRVQIQLTSIPRATQPTDPYPKSLVRRERELLVLSVFWAADLPCPGSIRNGAVWQRGFLEGATLTSEQWLKRADDLVAATPLRNTRPGLEWNEQAKQLCYTSCD